MSWVYNQIHWICTIYNDIRSWRTYWFDFSRSDKSHLYQLKWRHFLDEEARIWCYYWDTVDDDKNNHNTRAICLEKNLQSRVINCRTFFSGLMIAIIVIWNAFCVFLAAGRSLWVMRDWVRGRSCWLAVNNNDVSMLPSSKMIDKGPNIFHFAIMVLWHICCHVRLSAVLSTSS